MGKKRLFDLNKIYKINQSLEDEIFSHIPNNFNNLEQAIFIYYQLCKRLEYSIDYYVDEKKCKSFFTTPENIQKIDGKTNRQVVCYTFDRIFLKMLFDKHLITEQDFWQNAFYPVKQNIFPPVHNSLDITIDGHHYMVDATLGVFRECDLTLSKFAGFKIKGWNYIPDKKWKKCTDELQKALQKVQQYSKDALEQSFELYSQMKDESDDWKDFSIDVRMMIFLQSIAKKASQGQVNSLAYIYKIKHLVFSKDELSASSVGTQKVAVNFMKNAKTDGVSTIVAFNSNEKIKIYQIDHSKKQSQDCKIEQLTLDQALRREFFGELVALHGNSLKSALNPVESAIKNLRAKNKKKVEMKNGVEL